jgi:hypothetical protein
MAELITLVVTKQCYGVIKIAQEIVQQTLGISTDNWQPATENPVTEMPDLNPDFLKTSCRFSVISSQLL